MEVGLKMTMKGGGGDHVGGCDKEKMGFEETELRLGLPGGGGGGGDGEVVRKRGFSETVDLKLNLSSKQDTSGIDPNDEKVKGLHQEKNLLLSAIDPAKPPAKHIMLEIDESNNEVVLVVKKETLHNILIQEKYLNDYRAQVVGWPPVRSFRKNMLATTTQKSSSEESGEKAALVKVSMDGAPYLRKVDLRMYTSYHQLSDALAKMFSSFTIGNCGSQGIKDFMNESKLMDLLNGSDYVPTYEDKDGDWMLVGDVPWDTKSCGEMQEEKLKEVGVVNRATCSFDL
ncbi:hypothetical protein Godav_018276, partial [Gossypium davidsonii]|nr:hypothetical protein [Gossypium davidsonii]MBA0640676.1 hypothetical protein [Gossypium klotzschianum]